MVYAYLYTSGCYIYIVIQRVKEVAKAEIYGISMHYLQRGEILGAVIAVTEQRHIRSSLSAGNTFCSATTAIRTTTGSVPALSIAPTLAGRPLFCATEEDNAFTFKQ